MSHIEDYAIVGDLQTAALIGKDGCIDWLCLPAFDSPACFASLLHNAEAGHWLLGPAGAGECTSRRYFPDTLVLETEWKTASGTVRLIDFMPPRGEAVDLIRIVEGVEGSVEMAGDIRFRFGYGKVVPWVRRDDTGLHAVAGPDAAYLSTPAPLEGRGMATVSEFTVHKGDRVPFVLTWANSWLPRPEPVDAEEALRDTLRFWEEWSEKSQIQGKYRDAVQRSLITLKALTYAPTGGIVAAATTSLPEEIGGVRNWDYRYCWLRDASLTLQSLLAAGYTDEAAAWREWLLRAIAGDPAEVQIMYAIDGSRRLTEIELDWLDGFEGSKPVRVGNGASGQLQLDVWGEVLDGLALTRNALMPSGATDDSWNLQVALMEHLEGSWRQPDNGLWEMRGPRQDFTHSKVMAWVAADRMARAVREQSFDGPVERWEALRQTIHDDVMSNGYDSERNTFTQAYGSKELDASLLLIGRVGFLPPDDDRVKGTIKAIENELTQDGFVLRYRTSSGHDGLPGEEGVFLACSFWLVDALHGSGRVTEAVELFEKLLALRNDVGLLSEEWDPINKRHLGNTPQAFSHLTLVASAIQLQSGHIEQTDSPMAAQ